MSATDGSTTTRPEPGAPEPGAPFAGPPAVEPGAPGFAPGGAGPGPAGPGGPGPGGAGSGGAGPGEEVSGRWRRPIRIGTGIVVGFLVLGGSLSLLAALVLQERTESRSFEGPVTRVQASVDTGDIVIRSDPAADGATVVVRSSSVLRTPRHDENLSAGVLRVNGSCDGSRLAGTCWVDIEVVVPPGTLVDAVTETGDVRVSGTAAVNAASDTGDVRVTGTSGPVTLTTDTGDLDADGLRGGRLSARTDTGDIELRFTAAPDQVDAVTQTGDVDVRVPADGPGYQVNADTQVGDESVEVRVDPDSPRVVRLGTQTGDVHLGTS